MPALVYDVANRADLPWLRLLLRTPMPERSRVLSGEARYLVLPAGEAPYLLARVRWPDIAHAISPAHPDWLDDPGLFELPYEPSAKCCQFG